MLLGVIVGDAVANIETASASVRSSRSPGGEISMWANLAP